MNTNPKLKKLEHQLSSYMMQIKEIMDRKSTTQKRSQINNSLDSQSESESFFKETQKHQKNKTRKSKKRKQKKKKDDEILKNLNRNLKAFQDMKKTNQNLENENSHKGNIEMVKNLLENTLKQFDIIQKEDQTRKKKRNWQKKNYDSSLSDILDSGNSISYQTGSFIIFI